MFNLPFLDRGRRGRQHGPHAAQAGERGTVGEAPVGQPGVETAERGGGLQGGLAAGRAGRVPERGLAGRGQGARFNTVPKTVLNIVPKNVPKNPSKSAAKQSKK